MPFKAIIDLVLLAILIVCVWSGYKKGIIMGVGGILCIIVAIYGANLLANSFSYDVVPALKPFANGYTETMMNGSDSAVDSGIFLTLLKQNGLSLYSDDLKKTNLDTTTATGKLMLTMLSALSQFERDLIAERTIDGLKAARARGRHGGRPRSGTDKDRQQAYAMYQANIMSCQEIADKFHISLSTLNRWISEQKRR